VDQVLGHQDTLNGIYTLLDGYDTGTIGDLVSANSVVPGFGGAGPHIYQHTSISEQHTFNATLLNEFRVGFNRMDAGYGNQDASQGNVVARSGFRREATSWSRQHTATLEYRASTSPVSVPSARQTIRSGAATTPSSFRTA